MDEIAVRPERPGDEAAIAEVIRQAFLSAEHASGTEHFIVDALRRDDALTVSLVAERGGEIVGHVAVSAVSISTGVGGLDPEVTGWFGLGPVSVLPDEQGRGIGTSLITAALEEITDAPGAVLLGDPAYYERFGFAADPRLELPGAPAEHFQIKCMSCPDDEVPRGTVSYHAGFEVNA